MVRLKCYHGTTPESAEAIVREKRFLPSAGEALRLGEGAYFFEQQGNSEYAKECARDLKKYHFEKGKCGAEYAILSCMVECDDEQYFDLYDPANMEEFHRIRYAVYQHYISKDPSFQFVDAAQADTATMNLIRKTKNIFVVRSPEFFGMFAREENIKMSGRRKYPKTFVPNVIIVCADVGKAVIRNIEIVERGKF